MVDAEEASFERLPLWIRRRVELLGFERTWVHEPIPALAHRSVSRAFGDGDFEPVMRVFARNADFLGKEDPFLFNFTDEERAALGMPKPSP